MLTEDNKQIIKDCLSQIAKNLPGFQPRYGQRKMIAEVAKAFSRLPDTEVIDEKTEVIKQRGESILVIEGPTGTGKSLAYLLPAIVMAKAQEKKLVVSSATITLQEQLANKDLPFLAKHGGLNITYIIAKGRGRYLCPHRLQQHLGNEDPAANPEDQQLALIDDIDGTTTAKPSPAMLEKMQRLLTLFTTQAWSGDRDVLTEAVSDELWSQVTNDRHGCIKKLCPYFSKCPFFTARNKLEDVDVIIANHDLLLADIVMGGGVILPDPANTFYCIDEAHHLADKAVQQFAAYHSINGALHWLEKMKPAISRALILAKEQHLAPKIENLIEELSSNLIDLRRLFVNMPELKYLREIANYPKAYRFPHGILPAELISLSTNLATVSKSLLKIMNFLSDILKKKLSEQPSGQVIIFEKVLTALGFYIGRAENLTAVWQLMTMTVTNQQQPPIAKWITAVYSNKTADFEYSVFASPVRATDVLSEHLWQKIGGAILTSATLRSLGSFDSLLTMTGLKNFPETTCIALDSPFNFQQQGKIIIPPMKSDPKDAENHTKEIIQLLPNLIQDNQNHGTLVLFASKKQMLDVAAGLPYETQQLLLIQGEETKEILLNKHFARINADKTSVLFGLASFAEGLDLPGKACTHVIIAKLPFAAPDDPVSETLAEWIEQRGGNAFFEITLPNASIRLIQAVGRLIRSETDTGTVTILDKRLETKQYGKLMLRSLPPFKRETSQNFN